VKDYYYILGIRRQADMKEIQNAFHKLSLKFHPNEHNNDPFYTNYYRRIKEAYTQLSDEQRRYVYDRRLTKFEAQSKTKTKVPPPVIASFFASKKASHIEDLITISWEVLNAEQIQITPIGQVASNGTQTVRLPEHQKNEPYIQLELEASNADSTNTVSKTLEIRNLSYLPPEEEVYNPTPVRKPKRNNEKSTSNTKQTKTRKKKNNASKRKKKSTTNPDSSPDPRQNENQVIAYILVMGMLFIIGIMLYIINSLNPIF
jgi:curved DNA-binding protein CbpA